MIIFVPRGDSSKWDETRPAEDYDAIANLLVVAGARPLENQESILQG